MSLVPGIHPERTHRPGASEAEVRVYEALRRQLPAGWYAWHSFGLRRGDGRLGETDFVIADPARGLLVLEVKGGLVTQEDGLWLQNGTPLRRPPMRQAQDFAHALHPRLPADGPRTVPFGTAVCFPDTAFDAQPSQDDLAGVVIGRNELPYLGEILPLVFEHALPRDFEVPRVRWIEALHRLWGDAWVGHLRLGVRAADLAERWARLTEAQQLVLESLALNDRVRVTGAAGSGKTLLAVEAARREAQAGRRVLYLCFTRALALAVARRTEGQDVTAWTVGHLARTILEGAGRPIEAFPTHQAGWDRLTLEAAECLEAGVERPFDTIVLDEAQDLNEESVLLVEAMARGRRLWAFEDPTQRFWPEREGFAQALPTHLPLPRPHRSPPGVQALADRYVGRPHEAQAVADALAEGTLRRVACPSRTSVHDKVAAEITRLRGEGLAPEQILVVSLRGRSARDAVFQRDTLAGLPVRLADDPAMEEGLVADSFLRVKGLERPAVIVTDLRLLEGAHDHEDRGVRMHIALTRALLSATVVAAGEDLASDPVLRTIGGA